MLGPIDPGPIGDALEVGSFSMPMCFVHQSIGSSSVQFLGEHLRATKTGSKKNRGEPNFWMGFSKGVVHSGNLTMAGNGKSTTNESMYFPFFRRGTFQPLLWLFAGGYSRIFEIFETSYSLVDMICFCWGELREGLFWENG